MDGEKVIAITKRRVGIAIIMVALLVLIAYFGMGNTLVIYNARDYEKVNSNCIVEYFPTWDGKQVTCDVGRGIPLGLSDSVVRGYLDPLRAEFDKYLTDNNLVAGQSSCKITVDIFTCASICLEKDASGSCVRFNSGCNSLPNDILPNPSSTVYTGKFIALASREANQYYTDYTSGGNPYIHYSDYACVLDAPYPTGLLTNAGFTDLHYKVYGEIQHPTIIEKTPNWVWVVGASGIIIIIGMILIIKD